MKFLTAILASIFTSGFATAAEKIVDCLGNVNVYASASIADDILVDVEYPLSGQPQTEIGTLRFRGENNWIIKSPNTEIVVNKSGKGFYILMDQHFYGSNCRIVGPAN